MTKQLLPKKAISVWRCRCTFALCIASFVFGTIGILDLSVCAILLLVLFCTYLYSVLFYLPKRYLVQKYCITNGEVCLEKGVYFKIKKTMSINKIQYIGIKVNTDEKLWNLCTITFYAVGTKITISQIEYAKALQIRKNLILEEKNEI